EVRNGAYVVGPAYIGPGAVVGPNAYVRSYSFIGAGARVGNAVEIKASVLMDGAHVSHLSYVGDSVLGPHVNFGAGTITANLRFDDRPIRGVSRKMGAFVGEGVKTGVHVSLMPGVRVGAGAWIFPGAVVYSDVPAGTRVSGIYRTSA
ncbi:MAG: nucleotidyl transferase, partial [Candidatus Diapherotrites archaeon]|nr:nucleotidyl transferase [Candidatus Diapherotrites archaeon]